MPAGLNSDLAKRYTWEFPSDPRINLFQLGKNSRLLFKLLQFIAEDHTDGLAGVTDFPKFPCDVGGVDSGHFEVRMHPWGFVTFLRSRCDANPRPQQGDPPHALGV